MALEKVGHDQLIIPDLRRLGTENCIGISAYVR